jgi:tight adherence protein B
VLVFSDGADTSSGASLPGVRQRLAAAEVPVDTVAFRTEESTTELLAELSTETGGRPEVAADTEELAGAFRGAVGGFPLQLVVAAEVPADLAGTETRLEVSLDAGDEVLFASIPVVLAVDLGASSLAQAPARRLSPLVQGGLLGLVFLGLLALGLVSLSPLLDARRRRALSDRLEQFRAAPSPPPVPADSDESAVARAALALSERLVRARGLEDRMALRLDRAGMRLRPHEWLLLRALACLTGAILFMLLIHPLLAVPLGALAGWVGTWVYQRVRVDRRRLAFASLLPDALQLVIGSLRSGFSLPQAIDAMARELPDPISSEFGRALGETRLGERLDVALDRVAIRMQNPDLTWAVVAIRVQQQVGGNLAEVLGTTVKTIRERESLRRHVRALSAEGRLSAWILVALPIVMGVFMFSFRPEYMRPLVTQPLGLLMLLAGVVLIVVGGFWMSRVVKIEV